MAVIAELALRAVVCALFGAFAFHAIARWLAQPTRLTLLLFVVAACITTGIALIAHVPKHRDWRPSAIVCSIGGTYGCMAYSLAPSFQVMPETLGVLMQVCGILFQIYAKTSLRRSFGILPANRGVVSRGAYRFVRHPMYLGYFVTDLAFLLTNFSGYNLLVLATEVSLQVGRILQEERLLSGDEQYRTYQGLIRYRLIPGVF